jgi:hypothetical protein
MSSLLAILSEGHPTRTVSLAIGPSLARWTRRLRLHGFAAKRWFLGSGLTISQELASSP